MCLTGIKYIKQIDERTPLIPEFFLYFDSPVWFE